MTTKQKILQELQNPKMLDLKFLFSEEVLDTAIEVLNELLDEERKDFDELINKKYKWLDNSFVIPEEVGIYEKGNDNLIDPRVMHEDDNITINSLKWQIEFIPIIINVCAFLKWEKWKTLLNFVDVETMFHEFGHALHEMLSKSKYSDLSWFNVEWDFVELPSQLMENWCNEEESMKLFAKHFETWEEIPKSMLETMENLKKYWTWNFTLRQNEFASLDMYLHSKTIPNNIDELDSDILWFVNNYSIFKKEKDYKMYAAFSHIFDWWYGAGYYSYMWAEIIEAQVWSIFKQNGIFDKKTANKFLDTILSAWTTKDASELFQDFAWVSISPNAFLDRKWFL